MFSLADGIIPAASTQQLSWRISDHFPLWVEFRPLVHRLLDREFVVPASQVLDEAMPGDHDRGVAVVLAAPHWTKPCLQPTVIAFDPVVGVSVGRCQAVGSSSSSTAG
jgi:hypothetical protein